MSTTAKQMWTSLTIFSVMVALASSANEYLPPSKGYNYEPPSVPFPTNANPSKIPPSGPYRPPSPPISPPSRPTYIPPAPPSQPTGPSHQHDEHDHHHHHEPGMPFDFSYAVNEDGNDYSHNAISDGDVTRGEYRVALPDGRTQIVKYTADWKNGFNAEVTYEGEARYPDQPAAGGYSNGAGSGPGQAYVPAQQGGGYKY